MLNSLKFTLVISSGKTIPERISIGKIVILLSVPQEKFSEGKIIGLHWNRKLLFPALNFKADHSAFLTSKFRQNKMILHKHNIDVSKSSQNALNIIMGMNSSSGDVSEELKSLAMYSVNKVNASIIVDKLLREMFYSLNWNSSNCQWNARPNKGKLKAL